MSLHGDWEIWGNLFTAKLEYQVQNRAMRKEGKFSLMIEYLYFIEGKTDWIENAPVIDWKSARK